MNIIIKKAYTQDGWAFLPGQEIEVDKAFGLALIAEGYADSTTAPARIENTTEEPLSVEFAIDSSERFKHKAKS